MSPGRDLTLLTSRLSGETSWPKRPGGCRRGWPAERRNHFSDPRHIPETEKARLSPLDRGGLVMWLFIESLYRDFCLARVQEMRKFDLSH